MCGIIDHNFILNKLAQVIPSSYTYSAATPSVNGSSATGHCSNVTINGSILTCAEPRTSVLFDGNIPTLTGLDGDMWASQLLTVQTRLRTTEMTFDFSATPGYAGVSRVEMVMFNCPQWGIGVEHVRLLHRSSDSPRLGVGSRNNLMNSCDSLVRVSLCIDEMILSRELIPQFDYHIHPRTNWMYIAELKFLATTGTCPPDTIVTPPPDTPSSTPHITTTSVTSTKLEAYDSSKLEGLIM